MIKITDEKGTVLWTVKDDASGLPEEIKNIVPAEPKPEEIKKEGE